MKDKSEMSDIKKDDTEETKAENTKETKAENSKETKAENSKETKAENSKEPKAEKTKESPKNTSEEKKAARAEISEENKTEEPSSDNADEKAEDNRPELESRLELSQLSLFKRIAAKKQYIRNEMEGMTRSQKAGYIFTYYKWPFILTLIIVFAVVAISVSLSYARRPIMLSVAFINLPRESHVKEEDFLEYRQKSDYAENSRIEIDASVRLNPEAEDTDYTSDSNDPSVIRFPQLCRSDYYDVIITDRVGLECCSSSGLLRRPEMLFDKELLSSVQDYEAESPDFYGVDRVYAYKITDSEFIRKLGWYDDEVYICFPGGKERNQDNAENFIRFLFNSVP